MTNEPSEIDWPAHTGPERKPTDVAQERMPEQLAGLQCDDNGCCRRPRSDTSTSTSNDTDDQNITSDAAAAVSTTTRFGAVATIDVHSPECLRQLAIGLARHCGMPVTTMGALDRHTVRCDDVEAARRLSAMDDAISALAVQFVEVTGLRGRRSNTFVRAPDGARSNALRALREAPPWLGLQFDRHYQGLV